jgi:hypothetical protein
MSRLLLWSDEPIEHQALEFALFLYPFFQSKLAKLGGGHSG